MFVFVVHVHFKNQCLDPEQTYWLWAMGHFSLGAPAGGVTKPDGSTIMRVQLANALY